MNNSIKNQMGKWCRKNNFTTLKETLKECTIPLVGESKSVKAKAVVRPFIYAEFKKDSALFEILDVALQSKIKIFTSEKGTKEEREDAVLNITKEAHRACRMTQKEFNGIKVFAHPTNVDNEPCWVVYGFPVETGEKLYRVVRDKTDGIPYLVVGLDGKLEVVEQ